MRPLRPADIHTLRAIVCAGIRLVALVLFGLGLQLFLKRILSWMGGAMSFKEVLTARMGVGEHMAIYSGLSLMCIAFPLWFFAKQLARRIIVVPSTGCPRCDYEGAVSETCPECGYQRLDGAGHDASDADSHTLQ